MIGGQPDAQTRDQDYLSPPERAPDNTSWPGRTACGRRGGGIPVLLPAVKSLLLRLRLNGLWFLLPRLLLSGAVILIPVSSANLPIHTWGRLICRDRWEIA